MMERIDFRDFMDGSYKTKNLKKPVSMYSLVPMIALPDLITGGYITLGIVGSFAIGSAIMEKRLMQGEAYIAAERLMNFVKAVLPIVAYAIILYMMFSNPFMRWVR